MTPKHAYGTALAGVDLSKLSGTLIVIEGPDSSGRSTQIALLGQWLEQQGHAVAQVGLRRSDLVGAELERAKEGNILSPRTLGLFYATDFYDQLENRIVPALRAGFVVLADRYIYTLMARAIVRGAEPEWVASVYSMAIVPDAVFYMLVPELRALPAQDPQRVLQDAEEVRLRTRQCQSHHCRGGSGPARQDSARPGPRGKPRGEEGPSCLGKPGCRHVTTVASPRTPPHPESANRLRRRPVGTRWRSDPSGSNRPPVRNSLSRLRGSSRSSDRSSETSARRFLTVWTANWPDSRTR